MYAYQNNILSIPAKLLYKEWELMAYSTYKEYCRRGKLNRTNQGLGPGNEAWVSFHDLSIVVKGINLKEFCLRALGKPEDVLVVNHLEKYIQPDPMAINFFAQHRKPNGKPLTFEKQRIKVTNCIILNAIETVLNDHVSLTKLFGKKKTKIWSNISEAVEKLDKNKWTYNLPSNQRSLKRRYNEYLSKRYMAFIHGGEGQQNALKVTEDIERLILALYCLKNKPYASRVHDMYLQFMGGAIDVFDVVTGELFDRESFFNDNNQPVELSEATILNYINKPLNKVIISKQRNGDYDFTLKVRPHVNRHAPTYSMSKISLDDRDIMHTKLHDGSKVMSYYAFDDLSTAMIGISHSKNKNHDLFLDCIRNMFQLTTSYGMGVPMQMEVERHLVSDFSDGLMKAGNLFPFVRFCVTSQEKTAERHIGNKKYGVEKDAHQNVGRHYARKDSNRVTLQKIFDETNEKYKEAKATYKTMVSWELEEQIKYNNQLHPNQKQFKGKTRLQVFIENVNPSLPKLNTALLAQYVGNHTRTTVRRSQYVTVQYEKYQLPSPQTISMLASNNYNVDAYYIPKDNEIKEVFLYQNGEFICRCEPVPTFNRANAEWTEKDVEGFEKATSYIKEFDAMAKQIKTEKLPRVSVMEKVPEPIDVTVEIVEEKQEIEEYKPKANKLNVKSRAIDDL